MKNEPAHITKRPWATPEIVNLSVKRTGGGTFAFGTPEDTTYHDS